MSIFGPALWTLDSGVGCGGHLKSGVFLVDLGISHVKSPHLADLVMARSTKSQSLVLVEDHKSLGDENTELGELINQQ